MPQGCPVLKGRQHDPIPLHPILLLNRRHSTLFDGRKQSLQVPARVARRSRWSQLMTHSLSFAFIPQALVLFLFLALICRPMPLWSQVSFPNSGLSDVWLLSRTHKTTAHYRCHFSQLEPLLCPREIPASLSPFAFLTDSDQQRNLALPLKP